MKIKIVLLTALVLAFGSVGLARSRTVAPKVIIKNLYAAHKAGRGPFFQTNNRALLGKFFTRRLADLIWKDAVNAKGEVGAIDFDPLYGSQDPQITKFVIMDTGWGGDSKFGSDDQAVVQVTFEDSGKERMVSFQFKLIARQWKIHDIHYRGDGDQVKLVDILTNANNAPQAPAATADATDIRGKLQVGETESVILYVGLESGDYAAYCFTNASAAGRQILAACKDGEQCSVSATIESHSCKVPGLEADLSASGKIVVVHSVKSTSSTSGIRGVDFLNDSYRASGCAQGSAWPGMGNVGNGNSRIAIRKSSDEQ